MRTALKDFLHDLLDLADLKLEQANTHAGSREGALNSACAALEIIQSRLQDENKRLSAQFALLDLLQITRSLVALHDQDYREKALETKNAYIAFRKAIQIAPIEMMALQSIGSDPWPDLGPQICHT
jgi:hypothetical protein